MANSSKTIYPEAIKKRLERLLIISTLFIGYLYIYIYQNMFHIEVKLINLTSLIQMPLIALIIIPLIKYLIIKPDPLQRSPSKRKSIRFFQNEFPSKYLLERCARCIEDDKSCPNYIKVESYSHVRFWFNDIFHNKIEKENPKMVENTFEKGYICKLLYYFSWILCIFTILGIIIIFFHHICLYYSFKEIKVDLTSFQILYPLVCVSIFILIKILNKPDANTPSGCWQAWREVNRMQISWLGSNENFLINLICYDKGGTKRFKEK